MVSSEELKRAAETPISLYRSKSEDDRRELASKKIQRHARKSKTKRRQTRKKIEERQRLTEQGRNNPDLIRFLNELSRATDTQMTRYTYQKITPRNAIVTIYSDFSLDNNEAHFSLYLSPDALDTTNENGSHLTIETRTQGRFHIFRDGTFNLAGANLDRTVSVLGKNYTVDSIQHPRFKN